MLFLDLFTYTEKDAAGGRIPGTDFRAIIICSTVYRELIGTQIQGIIQAVGLCFNEGVLRGKFVFIIQVLIAIYKR